LTSVLSRPQAAQTWITQFNLQKTTPRLPLAFARVHQMALLLTMVMVTTSRCSLLLIYRPWKDERL